MTTINLTDTALQVRFRPWEKLAGLVRYFDVPRSAVTAVATEPDGLRAARGVRAPGLGLPGRRLLGTWRGRNRRSLVSVSKDRPALRITLSGSKYDELLLAVDDVEAWAKRLTSADG
jgi:hypothetical protein